MWGEVWTWLGSNLTDKFLAEPWAKLESLVEFDLCLVITPPGLGLPEFDKSVTSSSSDVSTCLLYWTSFIEPLEWDEDRPLVDFLGLDCCCCCDKLRSGWTTRFCRPASGGVTARAGCSNGTELVPCSFCLVWTSNLSICWGDISLVNWPMTSMPRSEISFSRFFSRTCRSLVFEQYPWSCEGDDKEDCMGDCIDTDVVVDGKTGDSVWKM